MSNSSDKIMTLPLNSDLAEEARLLLSTSKSLLNNSDGKFMTYFHADFLKFQNHWINKSKILLGLRIILKVEGGVLLCHLGNRF